ncbi:conserved Plasmodium protein, unknown function [Plasmodium berghei]|uniref:Uncharacterized protein n=2 Tax=Plasmodium berghei TaxID=5821 RepID=A0A509AJT9_PLABA|nr:conserved Plasmodium protein, unknown function [Plasmodium berghei ANKA]CXI40605.1 conserved Plasmodium protein, unknown function [Plasmodium berghei]SCM21827.1 conserved Plasmodium protein, unknown function [Plasmodium berghei]SCN25075.1 conserved Plasmodium protein, unknown function [Plasmodium berghei]SCO60096.1 conserved Plasmodium protein, unknown function [Plasmodium berghei]SCO61630.1 conserved Plasmodium protein, unknown function [Plasmodium berghei]|eukprot:XP_034421430.1 conserved Plasmodium protein, unknown function [Plasmodium berghei ANKA]
MERKVKGRGIYGKTNLVNEYQINNAINLNREENEKNNKNIVVYSDECNTPCFINNSMKKNNKKRINIKIGSNNSDNKKYTQKKNKSFIKNIVKKIEEAYKNRVKNNTKYILPSKYNSTFYLNEYLNVEPTNNVLYRRRIPNETLYKSDFNRMNLKPFIRCNSLRNLSINNNEGTSKNNKAIIKISNVSPFETLTKSNINNSSKYFQPSNFYGLNKNKPDYNFNGNKISRTNSLHNTKIYRGQNGNNDHKISFGSLDRRNTYNSFGNSGKYNATNKETKKIRLHINKDDKENNQNLISKMDWKKNHYDQDMCLSSNNINETKYHKKNKHKNENIKTNIFIPSNSSKNNHIENENKNKNKNKNEYNMNNVSTNRQNDMGSQVEELCSAYGSSNISFRAPSKNVINGRIKYSSVDTKIDEMDNIKKNDDMKICRNRGSSYVENDTMVSNHQYDNENFEKNNFDIYNKSECENKTLFYNKRKEMNECNSTLTDKMDDSNKLCLYKQKEDLSLCARFNNDKNTNRSYENNSFNSEDENNISKQMSNTIDSNRMIDNISNRENSKVCLKKDGKKEKIKLNNIGNCKNFYILKGEMLNILDYKEIKDINSKSNHSSLTNSNLYTKGTSNESDNNGSNIYYSDDEWEMKERFKNLKTITKSDNINMANSKKCQNIKCTKYSQRKLKTNSQNKLSTNKWNDRNSQQIMKCDHSAKSGKSRSSSTKSYRNGYSEMRCKEYSQNLRNDEMKYPKLEKCLSNEFLAIENDDCQNSDNNEKEIYQYSDKSKSPKYSHTSKQSRFSKYKNKGYNKSNYGDKDNNFLNIEKNNKHEYGQTRSKNVENSIYHASTRYSNKNKRENYDYCKSKDNSILKTNRDNNTHKSSNTHLTYFDVGKNEHTNCEICEYDKESTNNLCQNEKRKVYKNNKTGEVNKEGRSSNINRESIFASDYNSYKKDGQIQNKSMNSGNYKDYENIKSNSKMEKTNKKWENISKCKEKKEIGYSSHYSGDSKRNKKKQNKLDSNNTYCKNSCKQSGTTGRSIKSRREINEINISNSFENSENEYKKSEKNENIFKSKNSLENSKIGMKGISSNYINERRNIYVSNILDNNHEENKQNKYSGKELWSSKRENKNEPNEYYQNINKRMSHLRKNDSMNFNPTIISNKHGNVDNIKKDKFKISSNLNTNYMSKENNNKSVCESSHNSPNDSIYYNYKNKPRRNLKSMYDVKNETLRSRHDDICEYNDKTNKSNTNYKVVENSNKVKSKNIYENNTCDKGVCKKGSRNRIKNYVSTNHINSNNNNSCNTICLDEKKIKNDVDINRKYKKGKSIESNFNNKNTKMQRRRGSSRFVENSHCFDSNDQHCKNYKNKYDKIQYSKMNSVNNCMSSEENDNAFPKNAEYIDLCSKKNRLSKNYTTISCKDDNSKNIGEKITSKINEEQIIYYTDTPDSEKSKSRDSKRHKNISKMGLSNYSEKNNKSDRSIKRVKSIHGKINKTGLNLNDSYKESAISNRKKTNESIKEQIYNSNSKNREKDIVYYSDSENDRISYTDLNDQKKKSITSQISNRSNMQKSKSKEKNISREMNSNESYIIDGNCGKNENNFHSDNEEHKMGTMCSTRTNKQNNENNNEKKLEKFQDNNSLRNLDEYVASNKPSIKQESKCSENEVIPITYGVDKNKSDEYKNNYLVSDEIKGSYLHNNKYKENLSEINNFSNGIIKNSSSAPNNHTVFKKMSVPCENNNVKHGTSNFHIGSLNGVIGLNKANEYMKEELNYYLSNNGNNNNNNNMRKLGSIQVNPEKVNTQVITEHSVYGKDKEDTLKNPSSDLNKDKSFTNVINNQRNMCITNNGISTENFQNRNIPLNNIPVINNNPINRKFVPMDNRIIAPKSCVLSFEQNNSFQRNDTRDVIKHSYSNPEIEEKKNEVLHNHGKNGVYGQNWGNNGMACYENPNTSKSAHYFGQGQIGNTNEVSDIRNNNNNIIYDDINNCYILNRNIIKNTMVNQTPTVSEPIHSNYGRNFYSAYYNNKAFSVPNIGTKNMNIPIYNNQVSNIIDNNKMNIIAGSNQSIQQIPPQDFRKFGTFPVITAQNTNSIANNNIANNNIANNNIVNNNSISNNLEKLNNTQLNTDKLMNNKYLFYDNGQAYIIGDNKMHNPSLVKSMSSYAVPNVCSSYKNI